MIIVFNCPHCAAILRMKEQYGGQRGRCPHCQGAITVPAIETDAGMDLIPLEGGPAAQTETAPAPATSAPLFSIESRLRSLGGAAASDASAGAATPTDSAGTPSDTGDSNIGLAPVDDLPHSAKKPAAASQTSALDPPPRAAKPAGPSDSTIGLAPVDDGPTHAVKAPPPPPPAARPTTSNDTDDFALAPLEEAPAKQTPRAAPAAASHAATPAMASAAQGSAAAVSDSNSDFRLTVICDGCGARMRVPPTSAGRQLTCPRCKKKLRVPEASAAAAAPSSSAASTTDTRAPRDTPSSSSGNLDIGMLGDLGGEAADGGEEASAAPLRAASAKGAAKGKGKKALSLGQSKGNTLLGMPPLVVYGGGAGAIAALVGGLAIVYFATKPAPSSAPPKIVAQTPSTPAPGTPSSPAPSTPAPAPTTPTPTNASPQPSTPQPGTPASNPSTTPGATLPGVNPMPMPTTPVAPSAVPVAPGPAQPVDWRTRIPLVCLGSGYYPSEPKSEDGSEVPLLSVPPIEPRPADPTGDEINTLGKIAPGLMKTQQPILDQLKQMVDAASIKQHALPWAELTAQGLEQVRQDGRLNGVPLPKGIFGGRYDARVAEEKTVVQTKAELDRLAQIPGAISALETALKERAAREPNGALAATLKQAQP